MVGDRIGLLCRVLALLTLVSVWGCQPEADGEEDRGDISLHWGPAPDAETAKLAMSLRQSRVMENVADDLNASLKLPRALPVRLVTCAAKDALNEAKNALYDPKNVQISLCYELLNEIASIAVRAGGDEDETVKRLVATWLFVFFHELGHALIHQYDLPLTVKQEDVVDNFSAVLLIQAGLGDYAALAAEYWIAEGESTIDRAALAGAHSLDLQRFYNVLCVVYGSDPHRFVPLVTRGFVKEERRRSCPAEYHDSVNAWETLLEPWAK